MRECTCSRNRRRWERTSEAPSPTLYLTSLSGHGEDIVMHDRRRAGAGEPFRADESTGSNLEDRNRRNGRKIGVGQGIPQTPDSCCNTFISIPQMYDKAFATRRLADTARAAWRFDSCVAKSEKMTQGHNVADRLFDYLRVMLGRGRTVLMRRAQGVTDT